MTELRAEKREILGKSVNTLRKDGRLPAVLYGEGVSSIPLTVGLRDFDRALKESGETSVLTLRVEGGESYNVLIHDVSKNPRTSKPMHADFYAVRMDKPIEAKVELTFVGSSAAVDQEGGILVKVLHELEVKALPGDMPHEIEVNLEKLALIDDKIHVSDIKLPKGVTTKIALDEVVVLVEPPRSDAELEAALKVEEEATPAEVKTEREVKAEAKAESEEAEGETEEPK